MFYVYKSIQKGEEIMNENKEFKPYIPADKITPEFTVTSIIMGVILAVIFGAANAYLGLRVGGIKSRYDCICFHSGSSYFHGRNSQDHEKELHSGEQHGPDNRFSR